MLKKSIRAICRVIWPVFLVLSLTGCFGSDGGDGGNIGWVTITEPTSMDTYTVVDSTTVNLSGEIFISPAAKTRISTVCNCVGLACFFIDDVECVDYTYYDSGVTLTVTNETTGYSAEYRTISLSGYIAHWSVDIPLALNENVIHVHAEDELGNWGEDQVIINSVDATKPAITATTPEKYSVVYVTSDITVTFSEVMDTNYITAASFLVGDGSSNITGEISFSNDGKTATLTPYENLAYDTLYTVTLTNNIQDPSGNVLETATWSFTTQLEIIQFGTAGVDMAYGVASDNKGNTYVTGTTTGNLSGDGNIGGYDVFLAKYDISGNQLWLKQFGTYYNDRGEGIAVDESGSSYVTGSISGDDTNSSYDIFLAKYDASGNQLWIKQFGTDVLDTGSGVALDANGNSYVTGTTSGDIAGTGSLGGSDILLAKYDASGNQLWITQTGSADYDSGNGIVVDANGKIYVTGDTFGDIAGTGNAGSLDVLLAKYDASGNRLWIKQVGTSSYEEGHDISVDTNGNSYVTGRTFGEFDSAGYVGDYDVFILKFDDSGNQIWAKQFGTEYGDIGYGISTDATGNVYTIGEISGGVFITMHNTGGDQLWIKRFGSSSSDDIGKSVDIDKNGTIHASGYTYNGDLAGTGNAGYQDAFIARVNP